MKQMKYITIRTANDGPGYQYNLVTCILNFEDQAVKHVALVGGEFCPVEVETIAFRNDRVNTAIDAMKEQHPDWRGKVLYVADYCLEILGTINRD